MKKYKDELIKSMEWLGKKDNTIFLGQSVKYSGNAIYNTLKTLPEESRLETPVFEEVQMGMSTGMAMNGLVPISCFPRFDFLMRSMDALVNHLDKMQSMTEFNFRPKVIIRTSIGSTNPLNGGIQHTQDYTKEMKSMLKEVKVVLLDEPENIFEEFKKAYYRQGSTLMIEHGDYYNDK
jgi:pyruvate/2-oxoglutarate/acetoin dehydrogenase E1 component|tara:strand:+ start:293 stop:826 length:534 start_codon:yes stop_codon:yes gene_type:complete